MQVIVEGSATTSSGHCQMMCRLRRPVCSVVAVVGGIDRQEINHCDIHKTSEIQFSRNFTIQEITVNRR